MPEWVTVAIVFVLVYVVGEVIITALYRCVLNPAYEIPQTIPAVIEGALERFFLFLCFVNGIMIGLLFFGALKIATHINPHDNPEHEGKSLPKMYYLIGNLMSATFAVIYFMVWRWSVR